MHGYAGSLAALLEADLRANGWDGVVTPQSGVSPRQYAMGALSRSFLKKFHNKEADEQRNAKALEKFLVMNDSCASYVPEFSNLPDVERTALGEAKAFIHRFCYRTAYTESVEGVVPTHDESILSLYKILGHTGFGPGANIGARSGDPYGKLAISRLTYTDPALLVLFKHAISENSTWSEQEQFRSSNYPTDLVQGSKMSFVPKSHEITRTICTEPILNMFFQKGIAALLERRLCEVTGIDLELQPDKNRELARRGSLTGEFGTIDLSSASDSMSRTLVREFFPPSIVSWLELTRSPTTKLESGRILDLQMISSMGNAYTFPLQTIFFTSLVIGAYRTLGLKVEHPRGKLMGNYAVFGDDIIVKEEAYDLVLRLLSLSGFTVNVDKSYNQGLFRESCGLDWYQGHNVRGVYITKLLDDLDCYSAFNRLQHWAARWDVTLSRTLDSLVNRVSRILVVPFDEDDEAGFKVPLRFARDILTLKRRRRHHTGAVRYIKASRKRCIVRLPDDAGKVNPAVLRRIRRKIPHWRYCPSGLLLLLLHGNIRDGLLLLRDDGGEPEYRNAISPRWDFLPSARSERPEFATSLARNSSLVWLAR